MTRSLKTDIWNLEIIVYLKTYLSWCLLSFFIGFILKILYHYLNFNSNFNSWFSINYVYSSIRTNSVIPYMYVSSRQGIRDTLYTMCVYDQYVHLQQVCTLDKICNKQEVSNKQSNELDSHTLTDTYTLACQINAHLFIYLSNNI